jgi:hypothetical protein
MRFKLELKSTTHAPNPDFIELDTLEELMDFCRSTNRRVILNLWDDTWDRNELGEPRLMIWDTWT